MMAPLFALLSPAGERACLSILVFHRVHRQPDPLFPGEVSAWQFDKICGWIARWFRVLPLPEAARRLREGRLPSRAAAITFDDGYADNHDVALPVLRSHGLNATFFIATGFLDGGRMWNDTLIEAVRRASDEGIRTEGTPASALGQVACGTLEERRHSIERLIGAAKYLPGEERDRFVSAIADRCGAALPQNLMMSSAAVCAMHREGMTIGAHTVSHPILLRSTLAEAEAEITRGREQLQAIIGERVDIFAYPNGKPNADYAAEHVRLVRDLGFDAAVSTAWGAARTGTDPFQLPRFTPWDRSRARFSWRLARNLLR